MRAHRLIIAVLALALLGLVPFSSAAAAKPSASESSARLTAVAPVSPRAKTLTAKIVKRAGGKLFMTGIVRPKKGPIVIQKATNCNRKQGTCNFKQYRKSKINKKGRYSTRVYAPRNGSWAWRAKKGSTVSEVWLTCVKRPGDTCPIP